MPSLATRHCGLPGFQSKGVLIESLDYPDFIARYDRPAALFYIDPPYFGKEREYGDQSRFERADFERLAELLGDIAGRFILSLNDRPEVHRIFPRAGSCGRCRDPAHRASRATMRGT